jgi:hypothetical protein
MVARKRMSKDKARIDLGKIFNANKIKTRIAMINKTRATIERPADADGQPVQYKPA